MVLGGLNECGVIQRDSSDICDRNAMFIFNNWVEAKVTDEEIEKAAEEWLRSEYSEAEVDIYLRDGSSKRMRDEVCAFKAGYRACQEHNKPLRGWVEKARTELEVQSCGWCHNLLAGLNAISPEKEAGRDESI